MILSDMYLWDMECAMNTAIVNDEFPITQHNGVFYVGLHGATATSMDGALNTQAAIVRASCQRAAAHNIQWC